MRADMGIRGYASKNRQIPIHVEEREAYLKDNPMPEPLPDTWAIVELMGHVKIAGRLTEEEKFGGKLGRLDIPNDGGFTTQYFGAASVYRISLVTEEVARHVTKNTTSTPVSPWDFPRTLAAPVAQQAYDDEFLDRGD